MSLQTGQHLYQCFILLLNCILLCSDRNLHISAGLGVEEIKTGGISLCIICESLSSYTAISLKRWCKLSQPYIHVYQLCHQCRCTSSLNDKAWLEAPLFAGVTIPIIIAPLDCSLGPSFHHLSLLQKDETLKENNKTAYFASSFYASIAAEVLSEWWPPSIRRRFLVWCTAMTSQ